MKELYSLSIQDYVDMIHRYNATEYEVISLIETREEALSSLHFKINNDPNNKLLQKHLDIANWAYEEGLKLRIAAMHTGVVKEDVLCNM